MGGWPNKATITHFSLCLLLSIEMKIAHFSSFAGHSVRHCRAHNMEEAYAVAGKQHGCSALSIGIFWAASADCKECIVLGLFLRRGRRNWHARHSPFSQFATVNITWQTDRNNLQGEIHKWNAFKLRLSQLRTNGAVKVPQTVCYWKRE